MEYSRESGKGSLNRRHHHPLPRAEQQHQQAAPPAQHRQQGLRAGRHLPVALAEAVEAADVVVLGVAEDLGVAQDSVALRKFR
jgi:hypothetical protein